MPISLSLNNASAPKEPLRLMLYGKPKTRKTWWAGTAGATHRVIILDGENGTGILSNLPDTSRANITRIPLAGKPYNPAMALFCSLLFKKQQFLWDMINETQVANPHSVNPAGVYLDVSLGNLNHNDVLVVDSWTKIASDSGLQYMIDNNIDPYAGDKKQFDYYGYQDLVLDAILQAMSCLPCHLVLIGHEQYYNHKIKEGLVTREITRLQLQSSTGKHAAKLPAYVSDLLWFESGASTKDTNIVTSSSDYRDGGARTVPPATHQFSTWQFKDYAKLAGIEPASVEALAAGQKGFTAYSGQEILDLLGASKAANPTPVVQAGLQSKKPIKI